MTKHIDYGEILPQDELTRLLEKYKGVRGDHRVMADRIGRRDISLYVFGRPDQTGQVKSIADATYHKNIGKERLARCSRFLILCETGYIVKKNHKVIFLEQPVDTPREHVFKVDLAFGRPKLKFVQINYNPKRL